MTGDNRFVFVAPMYNASNTVGQMLASIFAQSYGNWKVILIDDMSSDVHRDKQNTIIDSWKELDDTRSASNDRIQIVWNLEKQWEVANVLWGIKMYCVDEDIVCRIDADDWLTDNDALMHLNEVYKKTNTEALWTAHRWGFTDKNISGPMPSNADVYKYPWVSSHLKTFRKRLINDINDENFRSEDGNYVRRAGDQAIFLPILHKTQRRNFINRCFYHYSIKDVPETYQTDDARFQRDEALFLRARGFVE